MEHDCISSPYNSVKNIYMALNATSSFLSIIGSSVIIYIMLSGGWRKLGQVHSRLLLGISAIDVLNSTALGLSFIPSPQLDDCSFGKGNDASCTAQGFFLILGLAVPGYITMLSAYYLATIVYGVTEEVIASKFEPFMHAFAVLPALICASIGAVKKYFFSQSGPCWIEDACLSSKECDGWDGFGNGQWLVFASMIWVAFNVFAVNLCMLAIYRKIQERSAAMRRYVYQRANMVPRPSMMDVAARETAKQALLYSSAFLFTYLWSAISLLTKNSDTSRQQTTLYILMAIFLPLQGFWNFLAYIRPRFMKLRREQDNLSFLSILKIIVFAPEEDTGQGYVDRRQSLPYGLIDKYPTPEDIYVENNIEDDAPIKLVNKACEDEIEGNTDSSTYCCKENISVNDAC